MITSTENTQIDTSLTKAIEELTACMLIIRRTQDQQETEFLAAIGNIGLHRLKVINIIGDMGLSTMTNIADQTLTSLSSTTLLVDKLVKGGLVTRLRTEEDRRVVYAKLTEKGEKLYQNQIEFLRLTSKKILTPLSGEEKDLLIKIFKKIADTAHAKGRNTCS